MTQESNEKCKQFVLVCQGFFCMGRGSHRLLAELREIEQAGKLPKSISVQPYYCFNGCSHGPNVVCYPDKVWFERVTRLNFPQVVAYLCDGTPPTDASLNQKRVLEVIRHNAYTEIEQDPKIKL